MVHWRSLPQPFESAWRHIHIAQQRHADHADAIGLGAAFEVLGPGKVFLIDTVIRYIRTAEIGETDARKTAGIHVALEILEILTPIDIRIGQVVGACQRSAGEPIKERKIVRMDGANLDDLADYDQGNDEPSSHRT